MTYAVSVFTALLCWTATAHADPGVSPGVDGEGVAPLPPIVPIVWAPKYPFPFDQTKGSVTESDLTAEREMCEWYNAQYDTLIKQINNFDVRLIHNNGDYGVDGLSVEADAVTANIDQSVDYLGARTQALTQLKDFAGDNYFPLFQAESFYLLWQHLSNVSAGIRGRQPAWFVGPSVQRVMRWGSVIDRSHVCR